MKLKTDLSIIQLVIVTVGAVVVLSLISHFTLSMFRIEDRDMVGVINVGLGGLIGLLARTATEDHSSADAPLPVSVKQPPGESIPVTETPKEEQAGDQGVVSANP